MPHEQLQSCIEACNACAAACDHCAVSCVKEQATSGPDKGRVPLRIKGRR